SPPPPASSEWFFGGSSSRSDEDPPKFELTSAGGAAGHVAEGDVLVLRQFAGHAEDALGDDVAGHLGGAAADLRRLTHEEERAGVLERVAAVVLGPGDAQLTGDFERDGEAAYSGRAVVQPADRRGLIGKRARRDPLSEPLLELLAHQVEHPC